ncbi:MAG: hypothetical protein KBC57_11495 [Neisseriaceae bacterium]|nr:hypothetical protein [Neisseriaceae bacterium]MBP6862958.1 hypothetical protein [Neisseriaceae bacterium]
MNWLNPSAIILTATLTLSACSTLAPTYPTSIDNVQTLKGAGFIAAQVGNFSDSPSKDNANPISIRSNPMSSPYANSYAKYIEAALKDELQLANKLQNDASVEISGELLKNDMTTGMSEGNSHIEARFMVKKADAVVYDQIKTAHHSWPSNFVGAIAIPRSIQEYPTTIQILLKNLYADPAFIKALN